MVATFWLTSRLLIMNQRFTIFQLAMCGFFWRGVLLRKEGHGGEIGLYEPQVAIVVFFLCYVEYW